MSATVMSKTKLPLKKKIFYFVDLSFYFPLYLNYSLYFQCLVNTNLFRFNLKSIWSVFSRIRKVLSNFIFLVWFEKKSNKLENIAKLYNCLLYRVSQKHLNSVKNSISSLLWISIVIPNFKSHNIIMFII